ncbi:hypothetical protein P9112_007949 [Eukaryota sp. TZLM1-RC]
MSRENYCIDGSFEMLDSRLDSLVGVQSISNGLGFTLLLSCSGDVYGWGRNNYGQILNNGPPLIKTPIKLPLANVTSISAGDYHSLVLCSDGKCLGWGWNAFNQVDMSKMKLLPITRIKFPYKLKKLYGGFWCSFALTDQGKVVRWGHYQSFQVMEQLNNIVSLWVAGNSFIALDEFGDYFYFDEVYFTKIPVTQHFTPTTTPKDSVFLVRNCFGIIDINGLVWIYKRDDKVDSFTNQPYHVQGLTNVVSISGYQGVFAAVDNSGKVFVWGNLSEFTDVHQNRNDPLCLEPLTNMEGISVGNDYLYAYNKDIVWAWGRNYKGELGTGDEHHLETPVNVFGSEILGTFQCPRQPLERMFSGLIKLVYFQYFKFLKHLFGNHPYVKARFYTKCSISKRVAKLAKEVINCHLDHVFLSLGADQQLHLDQNICDLQLRLTTEFKALAAINPRIKKLDVYYDGVDNDPFVDNFSVFPNVEVVKFGGRSRSRKFSIYLAHLLKLKVLQLDCSIKIIQLPTSLVKLVLNNDGIEIFDLNHLTSLKELVLSPGLSKRLLKGQIPLPQSIIRLEVGLDCSLKIEIFFSKLRELIIHWNVPTNFNEPSFPSLKFIQSIRPYERSLSDSSLSPTKLISLGVIKSVKLIKNEYLVELSCFPWWIQFFRRPFLIDVFREYTDE